MRQTEACDAFQLQLPFRNSNTAKFHLDFVVVQPPMRQRYHQNSSTGLSERQIGTTAFAEGRAKGLLSDGRIPAARVMELGHIALSENHAPPAYPSSLFPSIQKDDARTGMAASERLKSICGK
jgi:hypothetical protein